MNTKTTLILFAVIFSLGVLTIVVLPFFFSGEPRTDQTDETNTNTEVILNKGVFRSDDGGKTWEQKPWVEGENASIAEFRVNRLVPDPVSAETLFLLTNGNGLWMSRSRGDLWAPVVDEAGILNPRSNVLSIAVRPDAPGQWYVAVFQENRGRLLRTDDAGRHFVEVYATPLERYGVFDAHYDRVRKAVVLVTGQGLMLESTNQGKTWRRVRMFADGLIRLIANPVRPSVWLVTTPEGNVFRTEDRGATWVDITSALSSFSGSLQDQHWSTGSEGTIYLGSGYGLLRSRDDGSTFEAPPLILTPGALPILAIAPDPGNASRIIVSADTQLYATEDDGETWSSLPPPGVGRVTQLLIDREGRDTIYAVVAE